MKPEHAGYNAYAAQYAVHMIDYIGPCPWNPFPRNSVWGRMIDDRYREVEQARRAAIRSGKQ